jgi:hypothetical protein
MSPVLLGGAVVIGAAGTLLTLQTLKEGLIVEGQHWIMLAVILVVGYVLGRIWTTPAQMIGLP